MSFRDLNEDGGRNSSKFLSRSGDVGSRKGVSDQEFNSLFFIVLFEEKVEKGVEKTVSCIGEDLESDVLLQFH